jgi:malate dehydrogenase (oxaloacetate-decarboxylating)(NADP+)
MLQDATLDAVQTGNGDDDIERGAVLVLGGLYSALRTSGGSLATQRLLFLGAGKAAIGIADMIVSSLISQGVAPDRARRVCWLFDSRGLVVARRGDLAWCKRRYAHEHEPVLDFHSAVHELRPTAIIGAAGVPGEFSREIIADMARINDRPLIFVLSKPASKAECSAWQADEWSGGRAIYYA